jgi:hypothetical protein
MLQNIIKQLKNKEYKIFTKPFELNIIGIRNNKIIPNTFNDTINIFYTDDKGVIQFHSFLATTNPGNFWLQNPMNKNGTAILKPNQYLNTYAIGLHRNKYQALIQQKPVTVFRDNDKNLVLNLGKTETGLFGVNIHHAAAIGTTKTVDKYSAGCQVFANITDFNVMMQLAQKHKTLYGNNFTYTLLQA